MPYITQDRRAALLMGGPITGPGDLNFMIMHTLQTELLKKEKESYALYNRAIAILDTLLMPDNVRLPNHPAMEKLGVLVSDYYESAPTADTEFDVIGAIRCAQLELYRRMVAPYEDTKIAANGDITLFGGLS